MGTGVQVVHQGRRDCRPGRWHAATQRRLPSGGSLESAQNMRKSRNSKEAGMVELTAYSVKLKKKVAIKDPELVTLKNGRQGRPRGRG